MPDKRSAGDNLIGTRLGQYEIVSRVGRGGMATVYKARQESVGREVAIKVLSEPTEADSPFFERFKREVELIAKLEHLHILPIYDFGQLDGFPYLVMRYLDGGNLNQRIVQRPLELMDVNRLISQICAALDYAHAKDVIHRDMKPHNVLLDNQGNAYLCDFGIAKVIGSATLTQSGEAVGTPSYMSPEQWQGLTISKYTDIYALGIMLYEMLTGTTPFQSDNVFTLMFKHLNEPPPLLETRKSGLPPEFDLIIQQALEKIPERRFASAGEMARAFNTAVGGVATPSPAPVYASEQHATQERDADTVNTYTVNAITGRTWAVEAFRGWHTSDNPILFMVGPHGIGKSALAGRFAQMLGERVVRYELIAEQSRTLDPRVFVESMAGSLSRLIPTIAASTGNALDEINQTPGEAFEARVLEPLSHETEPIYWVIDSLDAGFEHPGGTIIDLIEAALRSLPEATRMIITAAPHPRFDRLFRAAQWLELNPEDDQLRADLRETLTTRFATLFPNLNKGEVDLIAVIDKAGGNPLYLNIILEHLAQKKLVPTDLKELPSGLDELYGFLIQRAAAQNEQVLLLLRVLAAGRAPLSDRLLADILKTRLDEVRHLLNQLRPLVSLSGTGWKLSHPALRYWLVGQSAEGMVEAHKQIAESLLDGEYSDLYSLQYLPTHLALSQQSEAAFGIMTDLNFLTARIGQISLAEVLDDLNQVKAALPMEADEQIAALDSLSGVLERMIPYFSADSGSIFSYLYNNLVGIPALRESLEKSAEARRGLWLRLIAPLPTPPEIAREIWRGEAILGLGRDLQGGRWLAITADGQVRLWGGGNLLRSWSGGGALLRGCALSGDGALALTVGEESTARLWDTTSTALVQTLDGHKRRVNGCALNLDGSRALTASDDKLLRLWDTTQGRVIHAFYEHPEAVLCGAFGAEDQDGKGSRTVISGCADGLIRVWDAHQNILRSTLKGHRGAVTSLSVWRGDSGAPILVSGGADGLVCIWDLTHDKLLNTFSDASAGITGVTVGVVSGRLIAAAASDDKTVRVWNLEINQPIARFEGHQRAVSGVILTAEGRVLSGCLDGVLRQWIIRTIAPRLTAEPYRERHTAGITGIAFSADDARLFTTSLDRTARLWRVEDGALLQTFKGHTGAIHAGALRPDGRAALTISSDKTARLWDCERGTQIRMFTGSLDALSCCALSPAAHKLPQAASNLWLAAAGGKDRVLRVWDADKGTLLMSLKGHQDMITKCLFSPTDEILVSLSKDRTVRLWSLATQKEVGNIEGSRTALFTSAAFSPDGGSLLLGLESGEVWRLDRATGTLDKDYLRVRGIVADCAYSRNGRYLFLICADGVVVVVEVAKNAVLISYRTRKPLGCGTVMGESLTLGLGDELGGYGLYKLEGLSGGRRKASMV
ncbi:MAG: protein kinase [Anaerolineae bacterium]|nr:protein kinase [Anaerolineae bacterium]